MSCLQALHRNGTWLTLVSARTGNNALPQWGQQYQERPLICFIIYPPKIQERDRKMRPLCRSALWQAYQSPASLGLPLSLPSACGRYEIYHLKAPTYPTLIIAALFRFVKDFFVFNQPPPLFLPNFHKRYDGVFIIWIILRGGQPQS